MKFTSCEYSKKLLNKIQKLDENRNNVPKEKQLWGDKRYRLKNIEPVDMDLVKKAIAYTKHYYGEQKLNSGAPCYSHPIAVAFLLSDYVCDTETMMISLLYNTFQKTSLTAEEIDNEFGQEVTDAIIDLTNIKADPNSRLITGATKIVRSLWNRRKNNVILIKLFDELYGILTNNTHTSRKQMQIIIEHVSDLLPVTMYLKNRNLQERIIYSCVVTIEDIRPAKTLNATSTKKIDNDGNSQIISSKDS